MISEDDSSEEIREPSSTNPSVSTNKRRKLTRACDICRRRKIKCDAPEKQEGEECTPCTLNARRCTFMEGAQKRGPPAGYMKYVENRIDQLEEALRLLAPTFDIKSKIGPRYTESSWASANRQSIARLSKQPTHVPSAVIQPQPFQRTPVEIAPSSQSTTLGAAGRRIPHESGTPDSSEGEDGFIPAGFHELHGDDLPEQFSQLQLGTSNFLGKSSHFHLVHQALSMKNDITGRNDGLWSEIHPDCKERTQGQRNHWETLQPLREPPTETLRFPPQDLSDNLIALYFQYFHPLFPTLHRASFEAYVKQGMHTKDPRVCEIPEIAASSNAQVDWELAGMPYFSQVIHFHRPFSYALSLLDLQNTFLMGFFGWCTHAHSAWLVLGHGVRCAMDLGAHRQKAYRQGRPLQNEVWKRTFWCLVNMDRMISNGLGQPPAVSDEDIDVSLPLDANDDTWDDSLRSWKPNNSPSHLQYFIHSTKLIQIVAFSSKTIYSINRSRVHMGLVGEGWEMRVVAEVDSALNNWADTIPDHLRWDPNITDPIVFNQAVNLNVAYHHAQIITHRRFLPGSSMKPSSLTFTSLAICTNAARSISHIVEAHLQSILAGKHAPSLDQPEPAALSIIPSLPFIAGVVLVISIWEAKRSGGNVDVAALTDDLHRILRYIQFGEERHVHAGRLLKMLRGLASVEGSMPSLDGDSPATRSAPKRSRDELDAGSANSHSGMYPEPSAATPPMHRGTEPTPDQTYAHYHNPLFPNLPAAAPHPQAQSAPGQGTNPNIGDNTIARDTPSSNFSPISSAHLPWLNLATALAPNNITTSALPVTSVMPPSGPSGIKGPLSGGSGSSESAMAQDPSYTGFLATEIDQPQQSMALEMAYFMLMENGGMTGNSTQETPPCGGLNTAKSNVVGPVATADSSALEDGLGVGYGHRHPLEESTDLNEHHNGRSGDTAWNPIPQRLSSMTVGPPDAFAITDWESWIKDNWGL